MYSPSAGFLNEIKVIRSVRVSLTYTNLSLTSKFGARVYTPILLGVKLWMRPLEDNKNLLHGNSL